MRVGARSEATADEVPRLRPGVDPASLALTPDEGYLLSRVDGRTAWRLLREMGGVAPDEVDRCLARWLAEGVVVIEPDAARRGSVGEPLAAPAGPAPVPSAPGAAARAVPEREAAAATEVDPTLDMPVELQRRLFELEARLDAPYPEILGIARDADRKTLKRAYFELSRQFHPDRYFRRNLGALAPRLERVFRRIVEAYELLSDPTARAEIERSFAEAGGDATRRAVPGRRPHAFSLGSRLVRERGARARRLFEAGMAAFADGRWLEAAGAVRLAIAFDPWNAAYKEPFAEVQRRAHEERARQLVKEAEGALELRDYPAALRAFEEALHYRPHDAELLHRAARLGWAAGGDLHQAKEWAQESVRLEPRSAAAHRLLGQIYLAAGLRANARRELEAALELDPRDDEARAGLRELEGPLRALRRLGGKR